MFVCFVCLFVLGLCPEEDRFPRSSFNPLKKTAKNLFADEGYPECLKIIFQLCFLFNDFVRFPSFS